MHLRTGSSYICFLSLRGMSLHSAAAIRTRAFLTGISSVGYLSAPLHAHGLRECSFPGARCLQRYRPSNRLGAQVNTVLLCNWKSNALFKLMRIHSDKAEDVNLLNSSPGCICLWPAVLLDKQQALRSPFTATIRFLDLDLPARRRRWLQLFGRDDLRKASLAASTHPSLPRGTLRR
ncbi:hypothetical protein BDR06DRAFT_795991 [Suillus hirtellus]|nr:hypothetical protein BDR06DRAFT_795991 [Suillus hirtellus]